jgi:hypothetical protein
MTTRCQDNLTRRQMADRIRAVEERMRTNDLHATLLTLMGLDRERLTFRCAGRDFRLTDVAGEVHREIFSQLLTPDRKAIPEK